ncbi:hypothetical protein B0T24DRAFT_705131 [Lasiosphaeria ovina]|uniref:Uncharacterized protein n=1 Tax=Lasiosphaeria ovina TaxID=92902 RepID=A0AAE0N4R3_9PEZI|nr:hypothetical protein B0T24DRAFT_705131 [Lasiosphaeria ovina]
MEFPQQDPNDSVTSETAPLIEPIDCDSDHGLFQVPLKRRTGSPLGPSQLFKSPPLTSAETISTRLRSSTNDSPPQQHTDSPIIMSPASSVYDAPALHDLQSPIHDIRDGRTGASGIISPARAAPPIPPLAAGRHHQHQRRINNSRPTDVFPTLPVYDDWVVPDSPRERLSQMRATPDSAYDRARNMEIHRSEWKNVVYRFPVKGKGHWVVDCDLTESSHARLSDVARRSSEGFEWNGDYDLANIYRVLSIVHKKLMDEMRAERLRPSNSGQTQAAGGGGPGGPGGAGVRVA